MVRTKKNFFVQTGLLALSLAAASCGDDQASSLSAKSDVSKQSRTQIAVSIEESVDNDNLIWSQTSLDGLLGFMGYGYDEKRRGLLAEYLGYDLEGSADRAQLLQVDKEGLKVTSANNVWVNQQVELKPSFVETVQSKFKGVEPTKIDVSNPKIAASVINNWVEEKTNELIKEAVSPQQINDSTISILGNALYFKGSWKTEFKEELTEDLDFATVSKKGEMSVKQVKTMKMLDAGIQIGATTADAGQEQVVTLRLPYKGDTHAMYIAFAMATKQQAEAGVPIIASPIVTQVDAKADVSKVYADYIAGGKAFERAYNYPVKFDRFTMPKFTIDSDIKNMNQILANAGYGDLFVPGSLSNMTDDKRAYVSSIFQKAKIIVNEEGTEAAAFTGGIVSATSISVEPPKHLLVNGPFAYAIRDDANNETLFEGVVRVPEYKE